MPHLCGLESVGDGMSLLTIAHAHHAVEVFTKGGKTSQAAVQAIVGARKFVPDVTDPVFQLSYTTLFGWYASYLFLRTGSIVPPLLAHGFCNYMGIYLPGHAIRHYPDLAFRECRLSPTDISYLGLVSCRHRSIRIWPEMAVIEHRCHDGSSKVVSERSRTTSIPISISRCQMLFETDDIDGCWVDVNVLLWACES